MCVRKIKLFDQAVDRFTGGRPVQLNMDQTVDRFTWKTQAVDRFSSKGNLSSKRLTGSLVCVLAGKFMCYVLERMAGTND